MKKGIHLRFVATYALCFLFIFQTTAQQRYIGVWRQGNDGNYLWSGVDWNNFNAKWAELAKQNLRLVDIETYVENGKRLYSGVWRQGNDGYFLWAGVDWNNFNAKWTELSKQNLRLVDIETYVENGKRLYIGVWRQGNDGHFLWAGVDWNNFNAKWTELAKQNLRLVDIETYTEGGKRLYIGVWRQGNDGHYLWAGVDWNNFTAKWNELAKQNLRLINIETYTEGGKRLYIGVWRQGSDGYYLWSGVDWENFTSKWAENNTKNLRLVDLEIYEDDCPAKCTNTVLMPDDPKTEGRDGYDYYITGSKLHCEEQPDKCAATISDVGYHWPNIKYGSQYYVNLSAIYDAKDPILTLPFKENSSDMSHNGWRYGNGGWHHALDYSRKDGKTFQVRAAAAGKVIHVGWDMWSGGTVVMSHDAGGKKDVYRTIYMHLRSGADNDCNLAWTKTMAWFKKQTDKDDYSEYLDATGCPQDKTKRKPSEPHWGTNTQTLDANLVGKNLNAGDFLAWAGSTGPGGCGCMGGNGTGPNTHLHIFFAHRDPTDNKWYFFDPYGIYATPDCYPTAVDGSINTSCARYPIAWKGGKPSFAN